MDNMLDISREAFPNPALTRLSSVLHESESATQRGIERAFPASLTGLAEHVKRGQNAEQMLERLQTGEYPQLTPAEVAPLIRDPVQTARLAAAGEGFLSRIFGARLDQVVDLVARQAGVSRTSSHVILGLSAPLLLDALSKESAVRHLDADGLSRFLSEQEARAHTAQPAIVDDVATAAGAPPIEAGRDVAAAPLFADRPRPSAPASPAAYVSSGIPLSQLHRQDTVKQAPTVDERMEEHFGEPSKLRHGLLWLLAAIAFVMLISWGLLRLGPRPAVPPTPSLPDNVGDSAPGQDRGASMGLPGGVNTAAPSEAATEAAINAEKPSATPRPINAPPLPALSAATPPAQGTGSGGRVEGRTASRDAIQTPPPLSGQAAVDALKSNPPPRPRAERLETVSPSEVSDTGVAALGTLQRKPAPAVEERTSTEGINESRRTATPMALAGYALPEYFERGAAPPQRFIVSGLAFAPESGELSRRSLVLDRVAHTLRNHPNARVLIEGHARRIGEPASEETSLARGQAVKSYLIARGVPARSLKVASAGAQTTGDPSSVDFVVLSR